MHKKNDDLYFISLNLHREKHKELIEWLKTLADEEEQSLSSLCIKLLKLYKKEHCDGTGNK